MGYWVDVWGVKVRRSWGEIRGWGFMCGELRPREAALNLGAVWEAWGSGVKSWGDLDPLKIILK